MHTNEQVVDIIRGRILRGVQLGTLEHGDRLSSARELSSELGVDHRVVLAAFRTLASEGILEVRERGGAYVRAYRNQRERLPFIPLGWLVDTFAEGFDRAVAPTELIEWFGRAIGTLRLQAVVIAENEWELAELTREIQHDFAIDVEGLAHAALTDVQQLGLLRRSDVLIALSAVADDVAAVASRLDKPLIVIDTRSALDTAEWEALLRKPLWVVVASAAFGQLLHESVEHLDDEHNLHILVAGQDDLATIPAGAPTYVSQRVRDGLSLTGFKGRLLMAQRALTKASARTLLEFIVTANVNAARRIHPARDTD